MNIKLVYSKIPNRALCQIRYSDTNRRERTNKQQNLKLGTTKTIMSLFRKQICRTGACQTCTRKADTTPRTRAAKFKHSKQQMCHQNFQYALCKIGYCKDVDVIAPKTTEGQIIILRRSRMDHKTTNKIVTARRAIRKETTNLTLRIKFQISDAEMHEPQTCVL